MKRNSRYFICLLLSLLVITSYADSLDSLFCLVKSTLVEQVKINNENDRLGRSSENKYVIVIDKNSVYFQDNNYVNSADQYVTEIGDGGNILSSSELTSCQTNISNFHGRRVGKLVKVKFYSIVINNLKFYFNKSILSIDTGSVYLSKLPGYIKSEKLKNLNLEVKKKLAKLNTDIFNEVYPLNGSDTSSNFIIYTYSRLSAVDVLNGQTQVKTYFQEYLSFNGVRIAKYARYIRKESAVGISSAASPRIMKVIDNIINAVEVYIDGGFVPLGENYCGTSFSAIMNDTKANRKLMFDKEATNFKSFINGSPGTNTLHFDKELKFEGQNKVFIDDVLKERLKALVGNSSYKVTFYFKEVPFVTSGDSLKLFAKKCVEGSTLDDGNNIVIVVPYFPQKCEGDLYFFSLGSYRGIPMPAVYCTNSTVKNAIETVLEGNGDLNTRLNNLFIHVPKKQHYIFGFINYEGNLIVKTHTTQTETTGETNVYTFKLLEDKRCKTLVANISLCQGLPSNLGYTTTAGGAVNTSAGVFVTTTDFECLKPKNAATMASGPQWQLIVHGLKESAVKDIAVIEKYTQWYTHENLISQLVEYPPPSNSCFIGEKNEVHYQNVLSVLDAVSTALGPTGLDVFFDAATSIYCLSQGETTDALIYATGIVAVGVSGGAIRGAIEGAQFIYVSVKTGNISIKPVTHLYCSFGGVAFKVSQRVSKKIYGQLGSQLSFNRLIKLKNDVDFENFAKHLEDALDNEQLRTKLRQDPQAVEDYFNYYKTNKSKTDSEITNDFLKYLSDFIRGIGKADFLNSVSNFKNGANSVLADQAWDLWKQQKWKELENLFKTNDINFDASIQNVWPPMFGFKSITHTKKGLDLNNLIFDRFQKEPSLGGGYASPVPDNSVFSLQARALGVNYDDLTDLGQSYYYYKFKIVNPPTDLIFNYGEAAPWFNEIGGAVQIKSSVGFHNLTQYIEIVEKWQFANGQWIKIL